MKNLILLFLLVPIFSFAQTNRFLPLSLQVNNNRDSIIILKDSIEKLNNRQLLTPDIFIKAYKYDRLYKYYRICIRNESQWKYYKGWSRRVFEQ